jgi:hypothetical protein
MKGMFYALVVAAIISSTSAWSQITFQWDDIPTNPGTQVTTMNNDGALVPVNLGTSGPNGTWDFTAMTATDHHDFDWMDPLTTPFPTTFPQANRCSHHYDSSDARHEYTYYTLDATHLVMCGIIKDELPTPIIYTIQNSMPQLVFPIDYLDQWTSVVTYINEYQWTVCDSTVYTVDAWGTVTDQMGIYSCLRVKGFRTYQITISGTPPYVFTYWNYQWYVPGIGTILWIESDQNETNPNFTTGCFFRTTNVVSGVIPRPAESALPSTLILDSPCPNPFNPTTTLSFAVPHTMEIALTIVDLTGREVARLHQGKLTAGSYAIPFNGSSLSSGVYFARLLGDQTCRLQKLVLLK